LFQQILVQKMALFPARGHLESHGRSCSFRPVFYITQCISCSKRYSILLSFARYFRVLINFSGPTSYHSGNFGLPFLCFAARVHSPDLADLLLKAGADVNIHSSDGITPLMILGVFPPRPAGRENLEPFLRTARRLLAAGAAVNLEDEQGCSALLYSLASPELAALLLKSGARANAATGSGWTPLTWAASLEKYADAIPLLLKAGAKPDQADRQGRLPLQLALDNGNGKAVALLQAALARNARK
jgi:ankyrin repeat protein